MTGGQLVPLRDVMDTEAYRTCLRAHVAAVARWTFGARPELARLSCLPFRLAGEASNSEFLTVDQEVVGARPISRPTLYRIRKP